MAQPPDQQTIPVENNAIKEDEQQDGPVLPSWSSNQGFQEYKKIIDGEDNITAYVADDVTARIRQAAVSKSRSMSSSSLSSCSGWTSAYGPTSAAMSRSSSYPVHINVDDVPRIDPNVLHDLESHARRLSTQLHTTLAMLSSSLHTMSGLTLRCMQANAQSVELTCSSIDSCIKSLYTLMAKSEELSKSMKPVLSLRNEIKEIKRVLDLLEPIAYR